MAINFNQSTGANTWSTGLADRYQEMLGRSMDAGGQSYWGDLDRNTNMTDAELQAQFQQGVNAELAGREGGGDPYLTGRADDITRRTQSLLDQDYNNIRSGSVATGGYGGGRMEVAQGESRAKAADYLSGNLANMYSQDWNADQGRGVQRDGQNQQFYTQQRGQDQNGVVIGANLWNMGNQGEWQGLNNANGIYGNYTGYGNTTNTSGGTNYAQGVGNGLATYDYLNRKP